MYLCGSGWGDCGSISRDRIATHSTRSLTTHLNTLSFTNLNGQLAKSKAGVSAVVHVFLTSPTFWRDFCNQHSVTRNAFFRTKVRVCACKCCARARAHTCLRAGEWAVFSREYVCFIALLDICKCTCSCLRTKNIVKQM